MRHTRRILVALDGTEASSKTVAYVAEMAKEASDIEICLFHLIVHIPAELREHGGSEDPSKEVQLGQELREAQSRWVEEQQKNAPHFSIKSKPDSLKREFPLNPSVLIHAHVFKKRPLINVYLRQQRTGMREPLWWDGIPFLGMKSYSKRTSRKN